ncbi:MAG: hypothetical protein LBU64_09020 [Planctomycetota bacterium]|jgi:hypothetical protein|nr:hypothetical protein [Planctomycetota bacterium]
MDEPWEPVEVVAETVSSRESFREDSPGRPDSPRRGSFHRQANRPGFSLGRVISLTAASLFKNPLLYLSLAFAASLPGLVLGRYYGAEQSSGWLGTASNQFFSVIFLGAITYGVYQDLIGGKAGLIEAVSRGLARYFPLVGITLLLFLGAFVIICLGVLLGFMLTFFLIVVPLLLVVIGACVYCVAIPACVVEGLGAFQSLGRSAALTRGRGWSVFGLFALYGLVMGGTTHALNFFFPSDPDGGNLVLALTAPLFTTIQEIMVAVLYYQLRVEKEGVSVDKLARVFD